jgi:arylformamidase
MGAQALTRVAFEHLTRTALDDDLSPSRRARDPWGVLARHERETAALDDDPTLLVSRDLAYGARPRQRFDLVRARIPGGPAPGLVFIHGDFWQEGSKAGSGFMARPCAAAGWVHMGAGYTLCPDATLGEIVAEIAALIRHLTDRAASLGLDSSRLILAGHSAGGHLATAMLAGLAGDDIAGRVVGVVAVSGVYDLAPIAASYVNAAARIAPSDVDRLSPLLHAPRRDVPVHLVIGADEPDAFHRQTEALHRSWQPHLSRLTLDIAAGRDHFDILDHLADPSTPTFAAIRAMVAP